MQEAAESGGSDFAVWEALVVLGVGLGGALIGGTFALVGSWLQGNQQAKALQEQFKHQRDLAAEQYQREQVAAENDRVRQQLDGQMNYGRSIMKFASAFEKLGESAKTTEEQAEKCEEALRLAGLSRHESAPYPSFLQGEEIEDEKLREMVAEHREHIMSVEPAIGLMDPSELPDNCGDLYKTVDALARQIGVRWRKLQREGKPI